MDSERGMGMVLHWTQERDAFLKGLDGDMQTRSVPDKLDLALRALESS